MSFPFFIFSSTNYFQKKHISTATAKKSKKHIFRQNNTSNPLEYIDIYRYIYRYIDIYFTSRIGSWGVYGGAGSNQEFGMH
jgi:hypothetical protein